MKYIKAILSLILFLIFLHSAPPTIIFGDGGEIVTAASTLGIAHPPGYPLYMLLSKIFISFLPGDQAFRVNVLAIILALALFLWTLKLAGCVFYAVLPGLRRTYSDLFAVAAAFFYTLSPHFFLQAVHEKGGVYTLAQLLCVIGLYYALKFILEKKIKFYYLASLIAGFLPVAHQSGAVMSLALLFLPAISRIRIKKGAVWGALFFFSIGLFTPYLYLYIRAGAHPAMNWADITDGYGVINHIFRIMYVDFDNFVPLNPVSAAYKISSYLKHLAANFYILPILALAGLAAFNSASKRAMWTAAIFIAANTFVTFLFTGNQIGPVYAMVNINFYAINDLILVLLAFVGVSWIGYKITAAHKHALPALGASVCAFVLAASIMTVLTSDRSRYFAAYDRAENVLKNIPAGSIFFSAADSTAFNILYIKYVKGKYADRTTYDLNANIMDLSIYRKQRSAGLLKKEAAAAIVRDICLKNPGMVFFSDFSVMDDGKYVTRPYGLVNMMLPAALPYNPAAALMRDVCFRDYFNISRPDYFTREELARYFVRQMEIAALDNDAYMTDIYRSLAFKAADDVPTMHKSMAAVYFYVIKDQQKAVISLEKAAAMEPFFKPTLELLANIYANSGNDEMAVSELNLMLAREFEPVKRELILGKINSIKHGVRSRP